MPQLDEKPRVLLEEFRVKVSSFKRDAINVEIRDHFIFHLGIQ